MITHIRMQNFKSWKDSGEVKLAPLTGFFGTNGSGKSSLLQMLLLLKQTAERSDPNEVIFFGAENSLVNLGDFREVIHGHDVEAILGLEFGCKLKKSVGIEISASDQTFYDECDHFSVPMSINNFTFSTSVYQGRDSLIVERFRYGFESCDLIEVKWDRKTYDLFYSDLLGEQKVTVIDINNCFGMPESAPNQLLWKLSTEFVKLFARVYYLGQTCDHPKHHSHSEGTHPKEDTLRRDKTIDVLLSERMRQLKTSKKEKGRPIEERISKWLQKMELAHAFSLVPKGTLDDNNYEVCIQKSPNSAKATLAGLGHGVADLFPLLVHCYYVPEGSTLILEHPGIHLHPKVQADLADLLIEVITERNLQILIESHSEHLLTRLQLRIAEGKIPVSDTALYFCENENGVSTIKSLDVDDLGNIKNWPKNFFGNVRGDLVKMTREQMKRQQKAEG